ncbi:hypothetical protein ASD97_10200 [Streptomyces sp. Root63]|nr:hypothetical protein ASD29_07030 [Streptomyces sp. Root1295]KRA43970.1 hypothetical protein ASD97_10200 [Streptomyces sp. Root63]
MSSSPRTTTRRIPAEAMSVEQAGHGLRVTYNVAVGNSEGSTPCSMAFSIVFLSACVAEQLK